MTKITIPPGAAEIIAVLKSNSFDAYIVGGCVRDSLLGRTPKDWDICTSAKPYEIIQCFQNRRIIETGLKHGTVAVVIDDNQFEVTTFRVDGKYSDNRHPDSVQYVSSLETDLARRDFTINAMAYNDDAGLIDPFGGASDIKKQTISCVRNPDDRFREDALRIMRALRFASVYGFSIDEDTARSIHQNRSLLHNIAAERITEELSKLICGEGVLNVLLTFSDVMATIIPELEPCIGFNQNNKYHCYTIYDHIAAAVANSTGDDLVVRMALLLHDIGKPCCYTEDENGGHFHGHGIYSHIFAEQALSRLRFSNKDAENILELVKYHDSIIEPTNKVVRRWLNKIGSEQFYRLINVRMSDMLAHSIDTQKERIEKCRRVLEILSDESKNCFTIKDMKISGRDVMSFGIPQGKKIGELLSLALSAIMNGDVPNEHEKLMEYLGAHILS